MFDTKEFQEFSQQYCMQEGWEDAEVWPATWIYDSASDVWVHDMVKPDPYELMPRMREILNNNHQDFMLVMTGWMTRIDEDDDGDIESFEERMRVRLFLKAGPNLTPMLCVEKAGTFYLFPDMGEGMFPELFRETVIDS